MHLLEEHYHFKDNSFSSVLFPHKRPHIGPLYIVAAKQ